ncbi:MAG: DUF2339 domain-containing protein [Nevskiales bacterium]|nr:DUF2339 domain-containing protein [Nevskiales bacterium]
MENLKTKPSVWWMLAWVLGGAWLLAVLTGDKSAIWAGGLLGYLFAETVHLRGLIGHLLRRLQIQETEKPLGEPPQAHAVPSDLPPPPVPVAASAETVARIKPQPSPVSGSLLPPALSQLDRLIGQAVAWFRRGNPLARAGIVVLFFGGSFLAKYSAERGLFPIELRFLALAAGALALLILGWRMRQRRATFSQILQGGGIAGLYLTLFAATRLYSLLPLGLALPLLVAVAVSGAVLAAAQGALPLAVIGSGGGFLAPILLSTDSSNHIALFSYYTALNLGIFAVAWFRAWRVLNLLGFVFTFGITGVFRVLSYQPDKRVSTDFFLLLFFLLYVAVSILFSLRQKPDLRGYVSGSLVFGLPVVAFTLHATLISKIEYGLAWSALGFGLFYLGLAWALFHSGRQNLRLLCEAFAALGVIFISLTIPLAFDRQTTTAMWAIEGAGLFWIGLRQRRKLARAFGAGLQLLGGVGYLIGLPELSAAPSVGNSAYVGTLMLTTAGFCTGLWLFRNKGELASYERGSDTAAALWAVAWWMYGGLAEIGRSVPETWDYGASLAFGALTLAGLSLLSRRLRWAFPERIATALLPLMAVAGIIAAVGRHPFAEAGCVGWVLYLGAGYFLLLRLEPPVGQSLKHPVSTLHAGLYWLLALLTAWESHDRIAQTVSGIWRDLPWGLAPALLLWAVARPLPFWPVSKHRDTYRLQGAAPLAAAAAVWIFCINLSSNGSAAGLPYLPLFNPLDVSVALILAVLVYWWASLGAERRGTLHLEPIVRAIAGGLVFLWLSAALVRTLHHLAGTPWDWHGVRHSFLVQASLSIFWGLLGLSLITLSARRAQRLLWLVGAGLMGVVVIKLFLIDLEGSGTLARIVSFLGVGGLLLFAGYLSPLPPSSGRSPHEPG